MKTKVLIVVEIILSLLAVWFANFCRTGAWFVLAAMLLDGCSKPENKTTMNGQWALHRGDAVETMQLKEADGIINGMIQLEDKTRPVSGMRSGKEVQLSFNIKDTYTNEVMTCGFDFKGALTSQDKLEGKCAMSFIHHYSDGTVKVSEYSDIWIAFRK